MRKVCLSISVFFLGLFAFSQEMKINQRQGLIQNAKEKHIEFRRLDKFEPDLNRASISRVTKIIVHGDRVFILDERQSRIFVFDKQANYLYSIGRPGQGPGDLEYPSDFFISASEIIYVLNSVAKRIEVFSLKGDFIKRLVLKLPETTFYSQPRRLLVDRDQNIFIAYNLSPHLIDVYGDGGTYLKTLLNRDDEISVPGENIGNSSQMQFLSEENAILHFNYFTGVFTNVTTTGKIESRFSAFDAYQSRETEKLEEEISSSRKEKVTGIQIKGFQLWSNFCTDNHNIYVFLLLKKKEEKQRMFVFSAKGDLLYWESIPQFASTRIDSVYCFQGTFVFKTFDEEIFLEKKEVKK